MRIRGLSTCPNHPRTAKPQRKPYRFDTERSKEGRVFSIVVVYKLSRAEFGQNGHREDTPTVQLFRNRYSYCGMTVACEMTLISDWYIWGDLLVWAALLKTTLSVLVSQVIQIQNYQNGVMGYCAIVRVIALLEEKL